MNTYLNTVFLGEHTCVFLVGRAAALLLVRLRFDRFSDDRREQDNRCGQITARRQSLDEVLQMRDG